MPRSLGLAAALAVAASSGLAQAPLIGEHIDRALFANPYAHIPAQCYIETAGGAQNACQFCHTDGLADRRFGNNAPQGGASAFIGDLTAEYAFAALGHPFVPNGSINPWSNTLRPETLRDKIAGLGLDPEGWDIDARLREDNWTPAFARRPGDPRAWDSAAAGDGFRFFPGLNPADLPAGDDGFVRSADGRGAIFEDATGAITGWRAVNFAPYGIFTPLTGSVSGIYIRLPQKFMRDASGAFDLATYAANLDLVWKAVSDNLGPDDPATHLGAAADAPVQPGLYPLGTEFAHPLHYVDLEADGAADRFPGARAARVKEIRYSYKIRRFDPEYGAPSLKEEDAPVYVNRAEGWIDNGAGWLLAAWIEDADGALRPQTPSELTQCVGCHSGHMPQPETGGYADFQSGVGVTVDSSWALPRKFPGALGWREMDAMGYRPATEPGGVGRASRPDPVNRATGEGEFAHFLKTVVGVSLYGDMPASVEAYLADRIARDRAYAADWPALDTTSAEGYLAAQSLRAALLRAFTAKREHLDADGNLSGAFLYPTADAAREGARRYGMVVASQSFDFGKDVFAQTPVTYRYFRTPATAFAHQDGRPYAIGEIVTDRPIDTDRTSLTWGVGVAETGVTDSPDYQPLLFRD